LAWVGDRLYLNLIKRERLQNVRQGVSKCFGVQSLEFEKFPQEKDQRAGG